jgi:hypothetical protein
VDTQTVLVDRNSRSFGEIVHTENDHHRNSELEELGGEIEIALEVGSVDNVDHEIDISGHECIPSDALVVAGGVQ